MQAEFDGILREEAVAEALNELGWSGPGTEQVYLNLNLSVSMTGSLQGGNRDRWHSPSLVLTAFVVAANLRALCSMEMHV